MSQRSADNPFARRILSGLLCLLIACAAASGARAFELDSWVGPHTIRLMEDGTEVEFIGGIGGHASAELAKLLDANSGVRVLQLTSQGGTTLVGMDMEQLVR